MSYFMMVNGALNDSGQILVFYCFVKHLCQKRFLLLLLFTIMYDTYMIIL